MIRRSLAAIGVVLVLAGCSDTDGDGDVDVDPVAAAEERVERAESALTDAQDAFASAGEAFCADAADYIEAVDRYGGAVSDAEATVGDITTAGADLERPRDAVGSSADEATAARDELAAAEQELADAEADLAALVDGTTVPTDDDTTTTEPLVPPATVTRVEQAESDLADAFEGIDDDTLLADATEQVNAAAFAVQVAWLRLFADAGCLDDDRQAEAVAAVADYTAALQTSLATAGYFEGTVDGVYGPETVDAVERLQEDAGLPVTGLVDRATAEALEQAVIDAGGAAETEAIVQTAALQSLLAVAGYWTGPIDGEWSDALTAALQQLQTDLGVPPTGEVDADTLDALQRAIEEGREPSTTTTEPAPDATTTVPTDDETTTTGA
jgi:peptidoglycan hydrolase-like protein with peptidoglycan-binding domain